MKQKRNIIISLVSASFLLAACGGNGNSTSNSSNSSSEVPALSSDETKSSSEEVIEVSSQEAPVSYEPIISSSESSISVEPILTSEELSETSEVLPSTSEEVIKSSSEEIIPSEESSEEVTSSSQKESLPSLINEFNTLVTEIKEKHNYAIDITSYIDGFEEERYIDTLYNYNDLAFYGNYYSGQRGFILQKDQGYVDFIKSFDGIIFTNDFYSTNPNVGISTLYDVVAENLFLADYAIEEENLFSSNDKDIIAVASNMSGYINTSWFIAPEKIYASVGNDLASIKINFEFTVGYIDSETGEGMLTPGYTSLNIHNIGLVQDSVVDAYVSNPSYVYEARTDWTEDEKEIFNLYFNQKIPAYIPGASYALSIYASELAEHKIYVTDYGCGNQYAAYEKLLKDEGFEEISNKTYQLVEINEKKNSKATYTVEMIYMAPEEEYGTHTIGYYYPEGVFQLSFKAKVVTIGVDSIESFNKYITSRGLDTYVPTLPESKDVTKISNFDDITEKKNKEYDTDAFLFCTSTGNIKIHIADYAKAKAYAQSYIERLASYGFTGKETAPFGTVNYVNNGVSSAGISYVMISNFDSAYFNESTYTGCFDLRFNLYQYDLEPTSEETPISSETEPVVSSEEIISSEEVITSEEIISSQIFISSEDEGGIFGTYSWHKGKMAGYDTYFKLSLNKDGTGSYYRTYIDGDTEFIKAKLNFTYSILDSSLTLVYVKAEVGGFSDLSTFRPFDNDIEGTENKTGVINEAGSISLTVYGLNGASPTTQTFSK